jgi:hypothetical protein
MLCPEWTEADFAQAKTSKDIPAYVGVAFPKTRGRPKRQSKLLVRLLDDEIFEACVPTWRQSWSVRKETMCSLTSYDKILIIFQ